MTKRQPGTQETIHDTLARFMDVQRQRLKPQSLRAYEDVTHLLEDCLNGYGYIDLDDDDRERFHRAYDATGAAHREFSELFGPERIVPQLRHFLYYFLIRKVVHGQAIRRNAGRVTKQLVKWLAAEGLISRADLKRGIETARAAGRDLPLADKIAEELQDYADRVLDADAWRMNPFLQAALRDIPDARAVLAKALGIDFPVPKEADLVEEGYFEVTALSGSSIKVALDGPGGATFTVQASPEAVALLKPAWTIAGAVVENEGDLLFGEVWNVYPA